MKRLIAVLCLLAVPVYAQQVDTGEVLRRGDMVQRVDGSIRQGWQATAADRYTEAMAMPKDDNDKFFISVLTYKGCAACVRLEKTDWPDCQKLLALADPADSKESWAHLGFYDMNPKSRQENRELFQPVYDEKGKLLTGVVVKAYPTILVQPPSNGDYGDPNTPVFRCVYGGDPNELADDIGMAIELYIEKQEKEKAAKSAITEYAFGPIGSEEVGGPFNILPLRPRPNPPPAPCPAPTPNPDLRPKPKPTPVDAPITPPDKDDGKRVPPRKVFEERIAAGVKEAMALRDARDIRDRLERDKRDKIRERDWIEKLRVEREGRKQERQEKEHFQLLKKLREEKPFRTGVKDMLTGVRGFFGRLFFVGNVCMFVCLLIGLLAVAVILKYLVGDLWFLATGPIAFFAWLAGKKSKDKDEGDFVAVEVVEDVAEAVSPVLNAVAIVVRELLASREQAEATKKKVETMAEDFGAGQKALKDAVEGKVEE